MARPKGGASRRRKAAACPLPPPSRTLESVVPGDALLADLSEGYTQSRCQPPAAPGNCGRPAPPSQTRSRGSCQGLFYPQILLGNQLFDDRLTASEEEQLEALLAADTDRQREYAEYVHAHALLFYWSAAQASTTTDSCFSQGFGDTIRAEMADHAPSRRRRLVSQSMRLASNFRFAAAALLVLALCAFAVYWTSHPFPTKDLSVDSPGLAQSQALEAAPFDSSHGGTRSVAIVTQLWHPVWKSPQAAPQTWKRIEVGHELGVTVHGAGSSDGDCRRAMWASTASVT
jgi:hypothetical protein